MAENYKHLYEQMKKMVTLYQDEIVPGMRKTIEDLEKNQIKVRCKDCKYAKCNPVKLTYACGHTSGLRGFTHEGFCFCAYGERREGE